MIIKSYAGWTKVFDELDPKIVKLFDVPEYNSAGQPLPKKVSAIKLYRAATGSGLSEGKAYVEKLWKKHFGSTNPPAFDSSEEGKYLFKTNMGVVTVD